MQKYVILEKVVGETPLACVEAWRATQSPATSHLPLAYAGRLDPMASGKLLILIGDECKVQEKYHNLDKEYEFSVLFGVGSDTGDVLGLTHEIPVSTAPTSSTLKAATKKLVGKISLPYPHFSSKTVLGKPLHLWTLEKRLDEITIPTKTSTIYSLQLLRTEQKTRATIYSEVSRKIETIPLVTEASKALGNDFRRPDIRIRWQEFSKSGDSDDNFTIATFRCRASSGSYMRSLAEVIAKQFHTAGLAYHIHRTKIGQWQTLPILGGFWKQLF